MGDLRLRSSEQHPAPIFEHDGQRVLIFVNMSDADGVNFHKASSPMEICIFVA